MHLFAGSADHHWLSFALGVVAGLITVFASKRLRRRKEER
jgi:hypothetical protein